MRLIVGLVDCWIGRLEGGLDEMNEGKREDYWIGKMWWGGVVRSLGRWGKMVG